MTDTANARAALRALAQGTHDRSEIARLRELMDDVEATLDAGVARSAVFETLRKQGFCMTLKSFESGYKILVLWMPEYLGKEGNKLLKLIEEPPADT
ncbi:MAG: hypothetical protein EOP06_07600, partial [Proteobacteria bacterium]